MVFTEGSALVFGLKSALDVRGHLLTGMRLLPLCSCYCSCY